MAWPLRSAVSLGSYTRPLHTAATLGRHTLPLRTTTTRRRYTRSQGSAFTLSRYTRPLHSAVKRDRYTWPLHSAVTLTRYPLHSTIAFGHCNRPSFTRPFHFERAPLRRHALCGADKNLTAASALALPASIERAQQAASPPAGHRTHNTTPQNKPSECCEAIRVAQAIVGDDGGNGAVARHRPDHHSAVQSAARKPLTPAH